MPYWAIELEKEGRAVEVARGAKSEVEARYKRLKAEGPSAMFAMVEVPCADAAEMLSAGYDAALNDGEFREGCPLPEAAEGCAEAVIADDSLSMPCDGALAEAREALARLYASYMLEGTAESYELLLALGVDQAEPAGGAADEDSIACAIGGRVGEIAWRAALNDLEECFHGADLAARWSKALA